MNTMLMKKENMLTLDDIMPGLGRKKNNFRDLVPLEQSVREDSDYFILERLKIISLKSKWDINEATVAIRDACIKEWYRRYGDGAYIPDVELSPEALDQIETDKEFL